MCCAVSSSLTAAPKDQEVFAEHLPMYAKCVITMGYYFNRAKEPLALYKQWPTGTEADQARIKCPVCIRPIRCLN
jgi:hypothetical protein